jgi:2-polyprenyl-3-methyl-5-hydroxy-6-metoxy-1,4-benzoquinol methylase
VIQFHQVPDRYLAAPRIKDYYEVIYKILSKNRIRRILDVGTASGDFLYFLPDQISALGLDSSPELIDEANKSRKKSNLEFQVAEFQTFSCNEHFDAITILGTLVTIQDWQQVVAKCIQLRPKLILIHDCFNPNPIDIKLGFKNSKSSNQEFNFGYNVLSIDSLNEFFKSYQVNLEISEFHMETELFKDPKNPMHNYHADFNGEKVLTNGSGLVLRMYNVIAQLNSN